VDRVVSKEDWGEWNLEETGRSAESVKAAPSRIVNAHSGVNCCASKGDSGKGDIIDHHDYLNNDAPYPDETRAEMDGERGGFTLRTPGHLWPEHLPRSTAGWRTMRPWDVCHLLRGVSGAVDLGIREAR
jgi:hypothetical protein